MHAHPHRLAGFSCLPVIIMVGLAALTLCRSATAIDQIWDGDAGGDNYYWNTPLNWLSGTAPVDDDTVSFTGSTGLHNTNDFVALRLIGMLFNAGASAFTLGGNALTLSGGITNSSATHDTQTINLPLILNSPSILDADAGNLWLAMPIANNGYNLTCQGSYTTFLDAACSGAGGLTKTGTGVLVVGQSNAYTGSTWFEAGIVLITNKNGLRGTTNLYIRSGARVEAPNDHYGASFFRSADGSATPRMAVVEGANSRWINAANLRVGYTNTGNSLIITNGGWVDCTAGHVGYQAGSTGNYTRISGANSTWSNSMQHYFGDNSSDNQLMIDNQGRLTCTIGYVGHYSAASNNTATISGGTWNNDTCFYLGSDSASNTLILTNGGQLITPTAYLGYQGSNNIVRIDGAGSALSNLGTYLYLGHQAGQNMIVASNGGAVHMSYGHIGYTNYACANTVLVTGADSLWSNRNDIYIGYRGFDNALILRQGGKCVAAYGYIGYHITASNNTALISDSGSLLSTPYLYLGYRGSSNTVTITNSGHVQCRTLYQGTETISLGNHMVIHGTGSVLACSNAALIGNNSDYNQLNVAAGGALSVLTNIAIGLAGSHNSAFVTGSGSLAAAGGNLYVGSNGSVNAATVADVAGLNNAGAYIGYDSSATGNTVCVTDEGAWWTNTATLAVGYHGAGNTVIITNGAIMTADELQIGSETGANENKVVIAECGSVEIANAIYAGVAGANNRLVITNGGFVTSAGGCLGDQLSASNNSALIVGEGSALVSMGTLYIGALGSSNSLTVAGCANATAMNIYIGENGSNNTVALDCGGLTALNDLYVGYNGAGNILTIANSGQVMVANNAFLGSHSALGNNRVVIGPDCSFSAEIYDIRKGTNLLSGGELDVRTLILTNPAGRFAFSSGILEADGATVANGAVFEVGNGSSPATNCIRSGTHTYANGMLVKAFGTLSGTGAVVGTVTCNYGAELAPGASAGTLTITNLTMKNGTIITFEKTNATADRLDVTGTATFESTPAITVRLVNLGGASFAGTNVLLTYGAVAGTPTWSITYGSSGASKLYVYHNRASKRFELRPQAAPSLRSPTAAAVEAATAILGGTIETINDQWASVRGAYWSTLNGFTPPAQGTRVSENGAFGTGAFTIAVGSLPAASTIYYRAFAVTGGGTGYTAQASLLTKPASPIASAASAITAGGFQANWAAAAGATNYLLDVATDSAFAHPVSGYSNLSVGKVTARTVSGLSPGTTYYYHLRAQNASGASAYSATISALTIPAAPPAAAASAITAGGFQANWAAAAGATNYLLDVATDSAFAHPVSGYSNLSVGKVTARTVSGLSPGTTYYYRLRAQNASGAGAYSATISALTIPAAPPAAAASAITAGGFQANWAAVAGATNYLLDVATDSAFAHPVSGYSNLSVGEVTARTVSGLSPGATYYYRLRAQNASGAGAYSATIRVTTLIDESNIIIRQVLGRIMGFDYDGDGRADPGLRNPATGLWYVWMSGNGYALSGPFGPFMTSTNDLSVPGDYDCDRRTDPAVIEAATGGLDIWLSQNGYAPAGPFGPFFLTTNDLPVPRDFDGDGRADPAVIHAGTGNWHVWFSMSGYAPAGPFGPFSVTTNEIPVPGDYDGDRRADPAVVALPSGYWYAWLSSGGYSPLGPVGPFATSTNEIPVPGDYDGDRFDDPAAYNPTTGLIVIWMSGSGYAPCGPFGPFLLP